MGLNYDKHKNHHNQDSMWTSYSDLFLGLSIVFLLLYVTASLRQGTEGVKQHMEYQKMVKESEDLRQQIKVYNNLKQNYLETQASNDEQEAYKDLMDKLNLLQDDAKEERAKLQNEAAENQKKEIALNKYQQMVRNIINSNMIAKSRIKNRDSLIDTKDDEISDQKTEIADLEKSVAQKKAQIAAREAKIEELDSSLEKRMKQLKNAYKNEEISKKKFEAQKLALEQDTQKRVSQLKAQNQQVAQQLQKMNAELDQTNSKLTDTSKKLAQAEGENSELQKELQNAAGKHQSEVAQLKGAFDQQRARDKAEFDKQMAKEKLSGDQRAKREAQFRADADRKAKELEGRLGNLDQKYKDTQRDLAKAMANVNQKKNLAKDIKTRFAANGIKAEVDPDSGDVVLSFGDQYFDNGRAELKAKMAKILEQAMPVYSASLLDNPKVAEKIQNVEIVGFASPTFKGKYIDPSSLSPSDREAVNFNLDLSYQRARSIFNYVFDKNKMSFKHQQDLLPLVKVTGRSFLANERDKASAGSKSEAFCQKNDCAKLQRVIIKFTLKD